MALRGLLVGSGSFGLVTCLAWGAIAQTPAPRPPEPVDPVLGPYHRPPLVDEPAQQVAERRALIDRRHLHDGLYARFAGGLGVGNDAFNARGGQFVVNGHDRVSATTSGFCGATELAIGATPLLGLAIGAGVYGVIWPAPGSAVYDLGATYEFAASQMVLFAPFADWYAWPRRGWHLQGGIGVASYVMGQGVPHAPPGAVPVARAHTALGYGFMLGIGHEWFVADQWSVGVLARVVRGWSQGNTPDGVAFGHDATGYSVLLSITYH
jgi:hypothetical protein